MHYMITFQTGYRVIVFQVLDRERSLDSSVSEDFVISPYNSSQAVRKIDSEVNI